MYAIEALDLVKTYQKRVTLYNFSIQIPAGSVYGLLGPNGAGKSTFIKIISGLEKQDSGTLRIFDSHPSRNSRRQIGFAPQENVFYSLLTCMENLLYYASMYGVRSKDAGQRAEQLLKMLGIGDKADSISGWLSGGMKRRLNLACSLMHNPKIIILDEPTTGLDPVSRMKMWHTVKELKRKENSTIILTTHYMEEAEELCDEIAFVNKGQVVRTGTPQKLKTGTGTLTLRSLPGRYNALVAEIEKIRGLKNVRASDNSLIIESKNVASKLSSITGILAKNNEQLVDLRISQPTLEDAFIKLTGATLKGGKDELPASAAAKKSETEAGAK